MRGENAEYTPALLQLSGKTPEYRHLHTQFLLLPWPTHSHS